MADTWWQRLPQRVLDEDAALHVLVAEKKIGSFAWKRPADDRLWLIADLLLADGHVQPVEIRFPERYPRECPAMRPLPYGTRLSGHQFGGEGVLCLELGPDNWHSRYMAADLLRSAWKLLALEFLNTITPIEIPSRHRDTVGMEVRHELFRMFLPDAVRATLESVRAPIEFQYSYNFVAEEKAVLLWPTEVPLGAAVADIPDAVTSERRTGVVVPVDDAKHIPIDVAAFRALLTSAGVAGDSGVMQTGLVLLATKKGLDGRYILGASEPSLHNVVLIPLAPDDPAIRRPTDVASATATARVAIIGLGSLGSKVAISLARSGVRAFALVDGDVFMPENVERHDADLGQAGLMKVEAVATRIRRVQRGPVEIRQFTHDVLDGSNASVHAETIAAIAAAHVVIDATANPDAFNFLADVASEAQRPMCWGEVFAGGLGGYVAYAEPTRTPCPACVRAAFHGHLADWPPAPRGAHEPYAAPQGGGPPMIATDADATVIAGALTQAALRLLTRNFDGFAPVTLVGLTRGWIFEHAFEMRQIKVRPDDFSCSLCWKAPAEPDRAQLEAVEELLTPAPRAEPTGANADNSHQR